MNALTTTNDAVIQKGQRAWTRIKATAAEQRQLWREVHATMRRLMDAGVRVECTLNGMVFDGQATDAISKATRDAVLAFMAAQGEADYLNRREMQARGIAIAKADGAYAGVGRKRKADYAEVRTWRAENGASIAETAEQFGISTAAVKRAMRETAD